MSPQLISTPNAKGSILFFLGALLVLWCTGCDSLSVQLRDERFRSEIDFKRVFGDNDVKQTRRVVEAAAQLGPFVEIFVDAGDATFRWNETGPEPDGDGWVRGGGARAPRPEEPGPGADWRVRVGYMSTNENMPLVGTTTDMDFKGWDTDLILCGYHAFSLGDKWLVAPCLGAFYKAHDGRMYMAQPLALLSSHTSYEFKSLGTYGGFRLLSTHDVGWEVTGGIYSGTSDTGGWALAAGIRF